MEVFPLGRLGFGIQIAVVAEASIETLANGFVEALDLTLELRWAWLDEGVPDALIFDMPVELGLELMTIVGADLPDPEGELLEDKVDVVDGVRLGVFLNGS